jgi:hypothetical protein
VSCQVPFLNNLETASNVSLKALVTVGVVSAVSGSVLKSSYDVADCRGCKGAN